MKRVLQRLVSSRRRGTGSKKQNEMARQQAQCTIMREIDMKDAGHSARGGCMPLYRHLECMGNECVRRSGACQCRGSREESQAAGSEVDVEDRVGVCECDNFH